MSYRCPYDEAGILLTSPVLLNPMEMSPGSRNVYRRSNTSKPRSAPCDPDPMIHLTSHDIQLHPIEIQIDKRPQNSALRRGASALPYQYLEQVHYSIFLFHVRIFARFGAESEVMPGRETVEAARGTKFEYLASFGARGKVNLAEMSYVMHTRKRGATQDSRPSARASPKDRVRWLIYELKVSRLGWNRPSSFAGYYL